MCLGFKYPPVLFLSVFVPTYILTVGILPYLWTTENALIFQADEFFFNIYFLLFVSFGVEGIEGGVEGIEVEGVEGRLWYSQTNLNRFWGVSLK